MIDVLGRSQHHSQSAGHSKHVEDHHEIIQHPNLESSEQSSEEAPTAPGTSQVTDFAHSKFVKKFGEWDEKYIKPFLIFNYSPELIHVMHHMHELFNHDVDFNASDHDEKMDAIFDQVQLAREAHLKFKDAAKKREEAGDLPAEFQEEREPEPADAKGQP